MPDNQTPTNTNESENNIPCNVWHFEGKQISPPVLVPLVTYVCPTCKREHVFPEGWSFMLYHDQNGKMLTSTGPLCIYCLTIFLKENIPTMVVKEARKP
jgi:hypothetical protein